MNKLPKGKPGIILALDVHNIFEASELIRATRSHISGLKIGWPLIMKYGTDMLKTYDFFGQFKLPVIADLKIADIGETSTRIIDEIKGLADYITVSGRSVSTNTLEQCILRAHILDIGTLVVARMTDGTALSWKESLAIAKAANYFDSDGVIAPATEAKFISDCRKLVGKAPLIIAPGVGAQGAKPGDALSAGADFEIVGRAIYQTENPAEASKRIRFEALNRVKAA